MRLLMLFVIFLFFGAFFIISENNLNLSKQENLDKFVFLYKGWLDNLAENVQNVSGYVVKLEWMPK